MFRPAARSFVRSTQSSLAPARTRTLPTRRFVSTQPAKRGRSWQNGAVRWGLAIAAIYYYNTSPVFAEQPQNTLLDTNYEANAADERSGPSLEVLAERRRRAKENQARHSSGSDAGQAAGAGSVAAPAEGADGNGPASLGGDTQELEEEAQSEGAFNAETGEINWDCPCLGGMAHGPCGEEFKLAFSCFVFSQEEPKGMDCIEKFQGMRDCFQRHPEVYKDELAEDEELDRELEQEKQELVQQIKERREREQQQEQQQQQQQQETAGQPGRLLEEPGSSPRVKVTRKVEQSSNAEAKSQQNEESNAAAAAAAADGQKAA